MMKKDEQLTTIGGQAVIEGVLFRGKSGYAVAVRRPDGEIVYKEKEHRSPASRMPWKLPILRGMAMLWDSMALGTSILNWSAEIAMPEEEDTKAKKVESGEETAPDEQAVKKKKKTSKIMGVVTIVIALIVGLGLFVGVPYLLTTLLKTRFHMTDQDVLFHVIDGVFRIVLFLGYILFTAIFKDIRRVYHYHGAEHKVINTYEAGEEPGVEKVREFTRFHPRCGTSFLVVVLMVLIVLHSIVFSLLPANMPFATVLAIRIGMIPFVAGIAYEFIRFSGRHAKKWWAKPFIFPGLMTQFITTREPDDDMLEVALFSFNKVRELEERIRLSEAVTKEGE